MASPARPEAIWVSPKAKEKILAMQAQMIAANGRTGASQGDVIDLLIARYEQAEQEASA